MSKGTKISSIIKEASKLKDRRLARQIRTAALEALIKQADFGLMQNFMGGVQNYDFRENKVLERGGEDESDKIYGVTPAGYPEKEKTDISTREFNRQLSTRYSPDRPGVQARRIADGVYQDPYTGKVYDWNEGFRTEQGEEYHGGGVSLQTELHDRMSS
jgi:hypothetical protein